MLEIPREWNEDPDLMMEEGDILPQDTRLDKRKRDEISRGRRKRRREDDIRTEKQEHSPTVLPLRYLSLNKVLPLRNQCLNKVLPLRYLC